MNRKEALCMKIKDLQVTYRKIPLKTPFKTALRTAVDIESIEVELVLENGMIGRGAAAPTLAITGDSAEGIEAALKGPIKDALVNADLYQFQTALKKIQTSCVGNPGAKAAADMACHDAYSKMLNIPLYSLLGGEKPLKTSMTVGVDTPEKMAAEAARKAESGFNHLKIKVGKTPEQDIERIAAIRKAIPETVKIRLDANQGWTPKMAVQLINEMEHRHYGIEFVEQPVAANDFEGLKFVTQHVGIPIMADESLFSAKDALKLVSGRYIDLLNIKLMKSGGIANAWKIATIAEANGIDCMVGSMMEPELSAAAAAHFAAAHPNVSYVDLDAPLWLSEELNILDYNGENLNLSDKPGIGFQGSERESACGESACRESACHAPVFVENRRKTK